MTFPYNILSKNVVPAVGTALLMLVSATASAQTPVAGVSETSASIGVGISRFNSGYIPINLDRPNIKPGQPFNIKPTMDSLITKGGANAFGGLLNRYDMSGFGKFFEQRAAAAATATAARNLPAQEKATAINLEGPQIYPPRLVLDYDQYPSSDPASLAMQREIDSACRRILEHYPLSQSEQLDIHCDQDRLILVGIVDSQQKVEALLLGLGLVPGVQEVTSELVVVPSNEPKKTDSLGYEL